MCGTKKLKSHSFILKYLDLNNTVCSRTSTTLTDSAFGEWDYHTDPRDDYIPSQRTLVTDQDKSVTLHSTTATPYMGCGPLTGISFYRQAYRHKIYKPPDIIKIKLKLRVYF